MLEDFTMTKTALILIDIQNDYFPGGLMPLNHMETAAANSARLLEHARAQGHMICHIRHIAGSDSAPFFRPGTVGSETSAVVAPHDGEQIFIKSRPNSFVGTELEAALRGAGIKDVILCGAMSQMCVDATARAAVDMGFRATIVSDACAAARASHAGVDVLPEQVHAAIMAPLAASYGTVVFTADLV